MAAEQILIVDDDEMQSKLATLLLEEAGYVVLVAGSAEQAREVLQSFQPRLILMDIQLPGLDGLELTRLLRLDPAYRGITILALTAYTHPCELEHALLAGCDGLISKPIDARNFAGLVQQSTIGTHPHRIGDSCDLLAELRNTFFADGLEQCATILKQFQSEPGVVIEVIQRIIHRWVDLGGALGFPKIAESAAKIEELLSRPNNPDNAVERALDTAQRLFNEATRARPNLPLGLAAGLDGVRVGLANFSNEEAHRIRSLARRSDVQCVLESTKNNWLERQAEYDAVVINACDLAAQSAPPLARLSIPAVFIGARSSLESFLTLPAQASDFVLAPWDAEEILMRVYRLIAKSGGVSGRSTVRNSPAGRPLVLIADDDPNILAIVSEVLPQLEMDCDTAQNGQQALDAARRLCPDAIVLDVDMPKLDGFEVLKRLRRNEVTAGIPVLLLTASGEERDVNLAIEYGADDYVTKPFTPMELANRVTKMIRQGSGSGADKMHKN